MKNIIIIGAGSLGRIVYDFLQDPQVNMGHHISGFLDNNPNALANYAVDLPILGSIDAYEPQVGEVFVLAVADPVFKESCYKRFKDKGALFFTIIHPTAYISHTATLAEGCIVAPYSYIATDACLGSCVFINAFSSVGHDAVLGDFTTLFSHCSVNGFCKVGQSVLLGAHTVVVPQVELGSYVKVVAGSTVIENKVKSHSLLMGLPASELISLE